MTNFVNEEKMGVIAIILSYYIVVNPIDRNDNRRHIHVYGVRKHSVTNCLAKIWIESNGEKDIEVSYNYGIKERTMRRLMRYIDENYDFINSQIDEVYEGNKTSIQIIRR